MTAAANLKYSNTVPLKGGGRADSAVSLRSVRQPQATAANLKYPNTVPLKGGGRADSAVSLRSFWQLLL